MKQPAYIPISDTERRLRTKIKTFFFCEEDETPSLEDQAIMVVLALFVGVPMVMGVVVRVLNL